MQVRSKGDPSHPYDLVRLYKVYPIQPTANVSRWDKSMGRDVVLKSGGWTLKAGENCSTEVHYGCSKGQQKQVNLTAVISQITESEDILLSLEFNPSSCESDIKASVEVHGEGPYGERVSQVTDFKQIFLPEKAILNVLFSDLLCLRFVNSGRSVKNKDAIDLVVLEYHDV